MVASRKPAKKVGERRRGESLPDMYARIMAGPVVERFNFDKEEAIYVLDRLMERPYDPNSMRGNEVIKRWYGLWPEPERPEEYPD